MYSMDHWNIQLCVLASGSRGNCSVLRISNSVDTRYVLIDLGLSPRRTFGLLSSLNISPESVTDAILTHLDTDHIHTGWNKALPDHTAIHLSKRHLSRAGNIGLLYRKTRPFENEFDLIAGGSVRALMMSHDEQGVAVFRFSLPNSAELGFATDLGRVNRAMIDHFKHVDVLAIESNYCPVLQRNSLRPEFLKNRIMSGSGHLSNQQSFDAVQAITPRDHVVLLHLSQECNHPNLPTNLHNGSSYGLTIATQDTPTHWIPIRPSARDISPVVAPSLFANIPQIQR